MSDLHIQRSPSFYEVSFVQDLVLDPSTTPETLNQWRNAYLQRNDYFPTKLQTELLDMVVSTLPASDQALSMLVALNGGDHAFTNADLGRLLGTLLAGVDERYVDWADLITTRYPRTAGWLAIDGQYMRNAVIEKNLPDNPKLERVWGRLWRGGLQRYRRYSPMAPQIDRSEGFHEASILVGLATVGQRLGWNVPMTRTTAQALKCDIATLMPDGMLMWMPGSSERVKELEQAAERTLAWARKRDLSSIAQAQGTERVRTTKRMI